MMAPRHRGIPFALLVLPLAALLTLLLLLAAACGSDETTSARHIDEAALAGMGREDYSEALTNAAARLADRHGGDEAAFYAVLRAVDLGYDAYQLLAGSLGDRLEADGVILSTDGSLLAPTRASEGIIVTSSGGAMGENGGRVVRNSRALILVASLSGLEIAALADGGDPSAAIQGRAVPMGDIFDLFSGREAFLEQEIEKEAALLPKRMATREAMVLISHGYGAQQIIEATLLKLVRRFSDEDDLYIRDPSGSDEILRPIHPWVGALDSDRSGGFIADESRARPTTIDPKLVRAALDAGGYATLENYAGTATTSASEAPTATTTATPKTGNTPPVAEDILTSTAPETPIPITLRGTDADGDDLTYTYGQPANGVAEGAPPFLTYTPADGFAGGADVFTYTVGDGLAQASGTVRIEVAALRYVGEVGVLSKPKLPVYRLDHSEVELIVAGDTVAAKVEFTLVAVLKWDSDDYLCTATMHRVYRGEGPRGDNVSIELKLVDSSDILEGPDRTGVRVPVVQSQVLEGTFADDGTFTGAIRGVWAIGAARVD